MSRILLLCLGWLIPFSLSVAEEPALDPFIVAIDQALKTRCLDTDQSAVRVVRVKDGQAVYRRNDDAPLLPASLVKLVTTAAALHYLGPDYRFKTQLLHTGARQGGVIAGDLILRGGGDPLLLAQDLWTMAAWLRNTGITQIQGDVVGETSFFDHYDRAPAWEAVRSQRAYDAKIGPLSMNFNTVEAHLLPGPARGKPLHVWLDPHPPHYHLALEAVTIPLGQRPRFWVNREATLEGVTVTVKGKLPEQALEQVVRLNVPDPARFAIATLRLYLERQGIAIRGKTRVTSLPGPAPTLLRQHDSPALSVILKELNTFSNNFMAEQILKTVAAEHSRNPGSHHEGLAMIQAFLRQLGVSTQGLRLADGSGLSRQNRMTARTLTDLLVAMLPKFEMAPDFIASLRIMGSEGGYRSRRFRGQSLGSLVRAKTGSLYKVSNLAGFVPGEKGQLFAYAVMLNNNECGGRLADQIENRVVLAIHGLGEGELNSDELHLLNGIWPEGRVNTLEAVW